MVSIINTLVQIVSSTGFLFLSAIGLTIIFGMMGVINLAHGELITIGAYSTILSYREGAPLIIAMVIGVVITTFIGILIERVLVSRLYGRLLDSVVVTWGLSLILVESIRLLFGSSLNGIGTPFGSVTYGQFSYSTYRLLLTAIAFGVLFLLYMIFNKTNYGVYARATIQNREMAESLGINTRYMYTITFGIGSGLAGLTGALYAPVLGITPSTGTGFLTEAFVVVITGGAAPLFGATTASGLLGIIDGTFSSVYGQAIGSIAILTATIVIVRILPTGLSGLATERVWEWE